MDMQKVWQGDAFREILFGSDADSRKGTKSSNYQGGSGYGNSAARGTGGQSLLHFRLDPEPPRAESGATTGAALLVAPPPRMPQHRPVKSPCPCSAAAGAQAVAQHVSQEIEREMARRIKSVQIDDDDYAWSKDALAACELLSNKVTAGELRDMILAARPVNSEKEIRLIDTVRRARNNFHKAHEKGISFANDSNDGAGSGHTAAINRGKCPVKLPFLRAIEERQRGDGRKGGKDDDDEASSDEMRYVPIGESICSSTYL